MRKLIFLTLALVLTVSCQSKKEKEFPIKVEKPCLTAKEFENVIKHTGKVIYVYPVEDNLCAYIVTKGKAIKVIYSNRRGDIIILGNAYRVKGDKAENLNIDIIKKIPGVEVKADEESSCSNGNTNNGTGSR